MRRVILNKYFIDMIEDAKHSEECQDYYNKLKNIANYENSIANSLFEEYNDRHTDDKETAILFCYDVYVLLAWFNGYADLFKQVFVILPNVDFAYTLSKMPEFELLFKHQSFKPIAFKNERFMTNSILLNLSHYKCANKGIMIYKYEAFDSLYTNIHEVLNCVLDYCNYELIDINTARIHGMATLENEICALTKYEKHPYTNVLYNIHKDKPIVCISAGRSLQDDLQLLKEIQDEVFIIACSAVVKPLINAGIIPDLVTVLDMQPDMVDYLDGIEEKLTVVVASCAYKGSWKQNFNFIIAPYVYSTNNYHYLTLKEHGLEIELDKCIGACLTVSFMSIQIANIMGANKIILLGQDLCYFDNYTHIDGNINCKQLPQGRYLKTETIDGKEALMDEQFQIYHSYLEKKINELRLDVINCSHGVRLPNTKEMSLITAYNEFLKGYEYQSIGLDVKTQPEPFKHSLKRFWTKLKDRCERMIKNNAIDIAKFDNDVVKYVRSLFIGVDRCFIDKEVDELLLLNMIIDVSNKYIEGV